MIKCHTAAKAQHEIIAKDLTTKAALHYAHHHLFNKPTKGVRGASGQKDNDGMGEEKSVLIPDAKRAEEREKQAAEVGSSLTSRL